MKAYINFCSVITSFAVVYYGINKQDTMVTNCLLAIIIFLMLKKDIKE